MQKYIHHERVITLFLSLIQQSIIMIIKADKNTYLFSCRAGRVLQIFIIITTIIIIIIYSHKNKNMQNTEVAF